jgi:adapter protein MecA 1/2
MKIEKVNENQIRCTLTREDLADRELKISELAYGTEKAKNLFRDMMQQASFECGFEAEDIPLMIEAIPLNADCIVLIITKVEDPEELDTRFAKFAPSVHDENDSDADDADKARIEDKEKDVKAFITTTLDEAEKEAVKVDEERKRRRKRRR